MHDKLFMFETLVCVYVECRDNPDTIYEEKKKTEVYNGT